MVKSHLKNKSKRDLNSMTVLQKEGSNAVPGENLVP